MQGWEHGVASDTDPEWQRRADELRAYHRQHGDTSVGFRDGDDPELARCVIVDGLGRSGRPCPLCVDSHSSCISTIPCIVISTTLSLFRSSLCHSFFHHSVTLLFISITLSPFCSCLLHLWHVLRFSSITHQIPACVRHMDSWANKQRRDLTGGALADEKAELLDELGFEWDEDEAEWLRWFLDLARCGSHMVVVTHLSVVLPAMVAAHLLLSCGWCGFFQLVQPQLSE